MAHKKIPAMKWSEFCRKLKPILEREWIWNKSGSSNRLVIKALDWRSISISQGKAKIESGVIRSTMKNIWLSVDEIL